jgi:hypothetical protein
VEDVCACAWGVDTSGDGEEAMSEKARRRVDDRARAVRLIRPASRRPPFGTAAEGACQI